MKHSIEDVRRAIASERAYQNSRWGTSLSSERPGNGERTLDEFALYIVGYAHKLLSLNLCVTDRLHTVRKVAALCEACREQHAPDQVWEQSDCGESKTLGEFIHALVRESNDLLDKAATFSSPAVKLDAIRQMARSCAACMMQHGALLR